MEDDELDRGHRAKLSRCRWSDLVGGRLRSGGARGQCQEGLACGPGCAAGDRHELPWQARVLVGSPGIQDRRQCHGSLFEKSLV